MTIAPSGFEHECQPMRHRADTCVKCGLPMRETETRLRNVELEQEITQRAAYGAVDPTPLIEFAESRARHPFGYGDVCRVRLGVDWLREAREEAADMRNYLCWFIEEHIGQESARDAEIALRFLALAYDRLLEEA